jgi:hypothetical protein
MSKPHEEETEGVDLTEVENEENTVRQEGDKPKTGKGATTTLERETPDDEEKYDKKDDVIPKDPALRRRGLEKYKDQ